MTVPFRTEKSPEFQKYKARRGSQKNIIYLASRYLQSHGVGTNQNNVHPSFRLGLGELFEYPVNGEKVFLSVTANAFFCLNRISA